MSKTITLHPKENKATLLSINEEKRQISVDGRECTLTQQEFSLLKLLIQHLNQPVSREELRIVLKRRFLQLYVQKQAKKLLRQRKKHGKAERMSDR